MKRSADCLSVGRKLMVEPDMSSSSTRLKGAEVGSKLTIDCLTPSS